MSIRFICTFFQKNVVVAERTEIPLSFSTSSESVVAEPLSTLPRFLFAPETYKKFSGRLDQLSIADLIESFGVERKTGILTVSNGRRTGLVYFREGSVVNASLGEFKTEHAVYQMLPWERGYFNMTFRDVDVDEKTKLVYHNIDIEEDATEKYLMDIRKRFGTQSNPETVSEGDVLFGNMTEVDGDGNEVKEGISKDVSFDIDYIKLKGIKGKLLKLKKGDSIIFNPAKAFKSDVQLSSMLGIGLNEAKEFKADMKFTLKEISHIEPAEMNEELFSKVYENEQIADEEQLRARIQRDIEETYKNEGKNQFMNDMVDFFFGYTKIDR